MHTPISVAPRRAAHRTRSTRIVAGAAGFGLLLSALAACSPGASGVPSVPIPSNAILPSLNVSPIASAASAAALAALDQLEAAVTANATASGVSSDDVSSVTQAIEALKTAIQTGDTSQIKTAVDNLSTKADTMTSKMSGATGTQLKSLIDALKAAVPTAS